MWFFKLRLEFCPSCKRTNLPLCKTHGHCSSPGCLRLCRFSSVSFSAAPDSALGRATRVRVAYQRPYNGRQRPYNGRGNGATRTGNLGMLRRKYTCKAGFVFLRFRFFILSWVLFLFCIFGSAMHILSIKIKYDYLS